MRFMLVTVLWVFALLVDPAFAGFQGFNQGQNIKPSVHSGLNCSTGLLCTPSVNGKMSISLLGSAQVAATAVTITKAQCGSTFSNAGAVEMELPEASTVIGCQLTFVTLNGSNFDVDPDAADQILVQTDAAGDKIRNATVGNSITLQAVSASQWAVVGILGTWADAN